MSESLAGRVGLTDLGLERLFVLYPGKKDYLLDERIEVMGLRQVAELPKRLDAAQ